MPRMEDTEADGLNQLSRQELVRQIIELRADNAKANGFAIGRDLYEAETRARIAANAYAVQADARIKKALAMLDKASLVDAERVVAARAALSPSCGNDPLGAA